MTNVALSERDVPIQALRPSSSHNVSVGAANVASGTPVPADVTVARIIANVDCYIRINADAASDGTVKL